jgi:hypothetical protein
MTFALKHIVLSTALASLVVPAALAQSSDNPFLRGRFTSVTDRSQPEFDPEPVRAGSFEISSSLGLAAQYNSNVFAASKDSDNTTADTILIVNPQIEAQSTWSSHSLSAGVNLERRQYNKYDTENVEVYDTFVDGRLDVLRSFQLNGGVFAGHDAEQRYEAGSEGVTDPIEYDRVGATAGALYQRDRIQLQAGVGTTEYDYDYTASFRDMTENFVSARGSYAISPDIAVFVQGRVAELDYVDPGTVQNPSRDGTRSSAQIGASFELQAPFRGEVAVGQFNEEKDASAGTDGLSVNGFVEWFPTQLTTVTFRANRGVYDSGVAESPSSTNATVGVRIDHELRRNILLFADFRTGTDTYDGIDREDSFNDFAAGVGYKLNKHALVEGGYNFHTQSSSGAQQGVDSEQHVVAVSIRLFP